MSPSSGSHRLAFWRLVTGVLGAGLIMVAAAGATPREPNVDRTHPDHAAATPEIGVAGRDELFRHAMTVTSEEEVEVFLRSAALLPALHAQQPLARILSGLRIPAAQRADGHVLLTGAFDSVYWTQDVAGYESALRQALPADAPREAWLSGAISPRARAELSQRGWDVHDRAAAMLK
jgi:hypothetical protein